jgi:hypothetical protein
LNYDDAEVGSLAENGIRLCRWTGSGYDCQARGAGSNETTNLVCADGLTELSDWAIGFTGPTDVKLIDLRARSGTGSPLGVWALLAGLSVAWLMALAAGSQAIRRAIRALGRG